MAGLSLAVTALLAILAIGSGQLRRLRFSLSTWAALGCLMMLALGIVGPLSGRPLLSQFHGRLGLAGAELPWHSVLLFDIGVMVAVAASVAAAGLAFFRLAVEAKPEESS